MLFKNSNTISKKSGTLSSTNHIWLLILGIYFRENEGVFHYLIVAVNRKKYS